MKTIAIVLTRYTDWLSRLTMLFGGGGYTHVSLALSETMETMYSFNFKGFSCETIAKYKRHGVKKSRSYLLQVPDAAYEQLLLRIRRFEKHRDRYRYSKLGVFLCYFRIPFQAEGKYFCSQFVAEALTQAGVLRLKRKPALYLPNHLMKEIAPIVPFCDVQYNPV